MVGAVDEDVSAEAFRAEFEEEVEFGSNALEGGAGRNLWYKRAGRTGASVECICWGYKSVQYVNIQGRGVYTEKLRINSRT